MAVNTGVDMSIYLKILEAEQRKERKDYEEEKYTSPLGQRNLGIFNTSLAITGTIQESRDNYLLKKAYKQGYFYDEEGKISKHDAYERSGDPGFLGIWEKDLKMVTKHPEYGTLLVDKDGNPLDYDQAVLFKAIEEGKMEDYSGQTVYNPVSGERFDWNKHDKWKTTKLRSEYPTTDEYKKDTSYSQSERAFLGLEDNYVDPEESDAEVLEKLNEIEAEAKANQTDYDTAITKAQKEVIGASYENNSQTEALEGIITDGGDPTELLESTGIDRDIQISGGIKVNDHEHGTATFTPIWGPNEGQEIAISSPEGQAYLESDEYKEYTRTGTTPLQAEFDAMHSWDKHITMNDLDPSLMGDGRPDDWGEQMTEFYADKELDQIETEATNTAGQQIMKNNEKARIEYEISPEFKLEKALQEGLTNSQLEEFLNLEGNEEMRALYSSRTLDLELEATRIEESQTWNKEQQEEIMPGLLEAAGPFISDEGIVINKEAQKDLETLESSAKMTEQNSEFDGDDAPWFYYKGLDKTMDYNSLEGWNNPVTGEPFKGAGQRNRVYDMKVAKAQKDFKIDNPDWDFDDWDFDTAPKTGNSFKKLINRMSQLFKPKPTYIP